jgi:hypothetical protein
VEGNGCDICVSLLIISIYWLSFFSYKGGCSPRYAVEWAVIVDDEITMGGMKRAPDSGRF